MATIRRTVLGLALLLLTAKADAQMPITGLIACQDCQDLAALPTPAIFGFKMPLGSRSADVLWDETHAGGSDWYADVPTSPADLWSLRSYWRVPQISTDLHVAIVTDRGLLMFAAGTIDQPYLGAIALQPTGSYPGALGPLVRRGAAGHAVEWKPVLEETGDVGDCRRGSLMGRGVIIGYDVYRLPVATHPAPSLRDFVVHGWNGFADVAKVDFDVPDPDGRSGSDLDPVDGLTLRNPDGLPDTGDEVLAFEDDDGTDDAWYRVQPVVFGDGAPMSLDVLYPTTFHHDLNGDTVLDAIDIDGDGFLEFIDPSGRGLGLTHGGEIATSLRAGRGIPAGERFECTGEPAPAVETECDDGLDDDGDGQVDCADVDCCGRAPCSTTPGVVDRVDVTKPTIGVDDAMISWTASPDAVAWDVLSGCIAHRSSTLLAGCLWGDRGIASATCLAGGLAVPSVADARPIGIDECGYYYLVRARPQCGVAGSYGTDSFGAEHVAGPGDCPP